MMNKQEAMKILTDTKHDYEFCWSNDFRTGFFEGIDCSLKTIKQIDEPEKPILTKEEAEWLEHLKLIGNFTYCLYIITRQGWGYDFEFSSHGKKYKLSCANKNDGDENELTKNRLVNALIYGYEVEKEKLYTVEIPNPHGLGHSILVKDMYGNIFITYVMNSDWRKSKVNQLTEAEIKKDFEWAWQFAKEVKE